MVDVFWENLSVSSLRRFRNIFMTYIATLLVIGGCFGTIYGINYAHIKLNSTDKTSPRM
jgi:hypothetical protein